MDAERERRRILPEIEISVEDVKALAVSAARSEQLLSIEAEGKRPVVKVDVLFPYLTTAQVIVHLPELKISKSYLFYVDLYDRKAYRMENALPGSAPLKLSLVPPESFIYAAPYRPKVAESSRIISIEMVKMCGMNQPTKMLTHSRFELLRSKWVPGKLKFGGKSIEDFVSAVYLPVLGESGEFEYPPFVLAFAKMEGNGAGLFAGVIDMLSGSELLLKPLKIVENAEPLYGYYSPAEGRLGQIGGELRFVYKDLGSGKYKSIVYEITPKFLENARKALVKMLGGGIEGKRKLDRLTREFEVLVSAVMNRLIKRCASKSPNYLVASYGVCGDLSKVGEVVAVSYFNPLLLTIEEARRDMLTGITSIPTEPIYKAYIIPMKDRSTRSHTFLPVTLRYGEDGGMEITAYAVNCKSFEKKNFAVWKFKLSPQAVEEILKEYKRLLDLVPMNPPTVVSAVVCEDYERLKGCRPNIVLLYEHPSPGYYRTLAVVLTDRHQFMVPIPGKVEAVYPSYGEYENLLVFRVVRPGKKGALLKQENIKVPLPIEPAAPIEEEEEKEESG